MPEQTNFRDVLSFMETMGQSVNKTVTYPSAQDIKLRLALILEETRELIEAVVSGAGGESNTALGDELLWAMKSAMQTVKAMTDKDFCVGPLSVADALTDILYVTYGAGATFGLDLDACFKEVHRSNMSKLDENGKPIFNEHGKVLKGPNYSSPSLMPIISRGFV